MPIITRKGKNREGKVVTEIISKDYCSPKNMHYYERELYMNREGNIPFWKMISLIAASENELAVFKRECAEYLNGKTILIRYTVTCLSSMRKIR